MPHPFLRSQTLCVDGGWTAWSPPLTAREDARWNAESTTRSTRYTLEEVAELLGIGPDVIRHAAFAGTLRADIKGHHIISLQRDDVLAWLQTRDGSDWGRSAARGG